MFKRGIFSLLACILLISLAFALDAEISTSIDSESGNFVLETDSASVSTFDAYDVEVPAYPDNSYAQLSSVVSGRNLMLDSFEEETDRTINLIYAIGSSINESEDISFTWTAGDFSGYSATLKDYGNDSSRSSSPDTIDMDTLSSYSSPNSYSNRYYKIVLDYTEATTPTADPSTSTGGGGGGGGGAGGVAADGDVVFEPSEFNINIAKGRTKQEIITVTNTGDSEKNVSFSQSNLNSKILFDQAKILFQPGETREVYVTFVGPEETGIYSGKILVAGNELLTTLNVRSVDLLFDAMIVVPDDFKKISSGRDLETQVTLIPMGDSDERVDVTLNYVIKDFDGNVYLIESETILVESQKNFKKNFNLNNLVNGNYIVSLELVYPNGVATSSSHFAIVNKTISLGKELAILIGIVLVLLSVLIFWRINLTLEARKKRGRKGK